MVLNDLETISLATSTVSIYCGIFFISDIPTEDLADVPQSVKGGVTLSETAKLLFFVVIMIANLFFFGYWGYKLLHEVKKTLIMKLEKIYLYVCLCNDRERLEKVKHRMRIAEENEDLREKYFTTVNSLKVLYTQGKVILTQ